MESVPLFTVQGPPIMPPPFGAIRGEHFFRGFGSLVGSLGGNSRRILERHDIDPGATSDPDFPVSCTTAAAILDHCCSTLDDRLFGLRLANYQVPDVYGSLSAFVRAAPSLRQAIESMAEYLPLLHCPGADIDIVSSRNTAEFRWHPYGNIGSDEQSTSHGLLLFVRFFTSFAGSGFRPAYVNAASNLSHAEVEFMEERLHCKVSGRAAATAIAFDANYLDRPLTTSNRILRGLLGSYLAQMKNSREQSLTEKVEAFVALELSSGKCSLERCADRLNIAVRTLHRHLTQSHVSFSEIVENRRCKTATEALRHTESSLDEIAHLVGYSEQSSFGRAFKKWTNMTPQSFRESH